MKSNQYVHLEKPEFGVVVVRKTCGELTVKDVIEAIGENHLEDIFAWFVKRGEFDGYLGEDKVRSVMLHNVTTMENCPVCRKARGEIYDQIYEAAYQQGYADAKEKE